MTLNKQLQIDEDIQAWLAARKKAGRKIDPNNAEVKLIWALALDPYGMVQDMTPEASVKNAYFVRSPESGGWVHFDVIYPGATSEELRRRMRTGELSLSNRKELEAKIEELSKILKAAHAS